MCVRNEAPQDAAQSKTLPFYSVSVCVSVYVCACYVALSTGMLFVLKKKYYTLTCVISF